jgi:hypothetical protein
MLDGILIFLPESQMSSSLSVRQTAELIHDCPSLWPFYAAMSRGAGCRQPCEGRETLIGLLELTLSSSCNSNPPSRWMSSCNCADRNRFHFVIVLATWVALCLLLKMPVFDNACACFHSAFRYIYPPQLGQIM